MEELSRLMRNEKKDKQIKEERRKDKRKDRLEIDKQQKDQQKQKRLLKHRMKDRGDNPQSENTTLHRKRVQTASSW